jgi:hypothetical protein
MNTLARGDVFALRNLDLILTDYDVKMRHPTLFTTLFRTSSSRDQPPAGCIAVRSVDLQGGRITIGVFPSAKPA